MLGRLPKYKSGKSLINRIYFNLSRVDFLNFNTRIVNFGNIGDCNNLLKKFDFFVGDGGSDISFSNGVPPYNCNSYSFGAKGFPSNVNKGSTPHPQLISINSVSSLAFFSSSGFLTTRHNSNKMHSLRSNSSVLIKHEF